MRLPEAVSRSSWRSRSCRASSARDGANPVYDTRLNANIDDSSVRATVISITNLGDSAGQWGGGPALGAIGSLGSIRAALAAGALVLTPAFVLYGRAIRLDRAEP